MKSIRVTIMLDEDLSKKLHEIQGRIIKNTNASKSFSSVINDVLRRELK